MRSTWAEPVIQSMFPDIKGSLPEACEPPQGKKSLNNGQSDDLQWTKDTFVRTGGALQAPIEAKAWSELTRFLGSGLRPARVVRRRRGQDPRSG